MVADFRRRRLINVCAVFASNIAGEVTARAFSNHPDICMSSVHTTMESAVQEIELNPYDIVVTNLHLRSERYAGIRLLMHVKQVRAEIKAIIVADSDDRSDIIPCFRAGVRGYLLEQSLDTETLCKAICCVDEGQIWANAAQLNRVFDDFVTPANTHLMGPVRSILTKREIEVVELMLRGKTNKEIGRLLELSEHTVKNHIVKVFAKLGVTSRAGAVFEIYKRFPLNSIHNSMYEGAHLGSPYLE